MFHGRKAIFEIYVGILNWDLIMKLKSENSKAMLDLQGGQISDNSVSSMVARMKIQSFYLSHKNEN